jgi:hypothetical protein
MNMKEIIYSTQGSNSANLKARDLVSCLVISPEEAFMVNSSILKKNIQQ